MFTLFKQVIRRRRCARTPKPIPGFDLPPEFDARYYRDSYPDLAGLTEEQALSHFICAGRAEGRVAHPAAKREEFLQLIDLEHSILEIGPMDSPVLSGPNVRYFDVLGTEELRRRCEKHGRIPGNCPEIHYVSPHGDLGVVDGCFDAAVSSHAIEHQPDLVAHLRGVAAILRPGGRYFVLVPDRRYCFDHFLPDSNLPELIDAHLRQVRVHDPRRIIEHIALTTHNDPDRHWQGDHGKPGWLDHPERIHAALRWIQAHPGEYYDCHAWQFTPDSFRQVLQGLFEFRFTTMRPVRVYDTPKGRLEFCAVLERAPDFDSNSEPAAIELPVDFDALSYLAANPDVAQAGCDPAEHYLAHGYRERRPLRPR